MILTFLWRLLGICVLISLLPAIIPQSWSIRYHAMNLSFMVTIGALFSFYLVMLLFCSMERSMRICSFVAYGWILLLGFDLRTSRNSDVLKKTGNAVIVVNHQSIFDPFPFLPLYDLLAFSTVVFGGSELSRYTLVRKAVATQGHTFLDRQCKRTAMKTLMRTSEKHFKDNQRNKILVFPEGERNRKMKDYKFLEFKLGAFRVARAFNVPIIPIVISPLYFIDHQRHYFRRGKSITSVLDPVYPGDMEPRELAEKVKSVMQDEFLRLKEELVDGTATPMFIPNSDNNSNIDNYCIPTKED